LLRLLLFLLCLAFVSNPLLAQLAPESKLGRVVEIRMDGVELIEKGILFNTLSSSVESDLSPTQVARDIKELYKLGYFEDIQALTELAGPGEVVLVFRFKEKPQIEELKIEGMSVLDKKSTDEKLKVHRNNMVNLTRIQADLDTLKEEYRKKGYLRTQFRYRIDKLDDRRVNLTYLVDESPKVYLTQFHIFGTKFFYPLDVERLLQSAEVDCFAWITDSGVFQEQKINQDLALITQEYMKNGFIKVHIEKPRVVMTQKRDLAVIDVYLTITEGDQYFTGALDIRSEDGNPLLFEKQEKIDELLLKTGAVYNPFKMNQDRFQLNDIYMEQGYAFAGINPDPTIHDDTKIVDVTYKIVRREKAYIGRVEIEGNYETQDRVVRRELEVHDNELFNGVKLRESQENITKLGFFKPGYGVELEQNPGRNQAEVDYLVKLDEAQTGSFNASLSYSGYSGLILSLGITKRNLLGTGKSLSLTAERRQRGESLFTLTMTNPYFFDTEVTNSFSLFTNFYPDTQYDTRSSGFYVGLSYPVWKNWDASTRYSFKNEKYSNISAVGQTYLNYNTAQTYRSLRVGATYSTVNNPSFPSNGMETSLFTERFGGVLGGTTEYLSNDFQSRYFKSLNEDETVVVMAQYRQSILLKTNPNSEIPFNQRYYIGGITTMRGHDFGGIEGPAGYTELPAGFSIAKKYPYQGDYSTCDSACQALPATIPEERTYYNTHQRGTLEKILNLEMLFPLTREGRNIRGLVFFDAGNVWSEDRMYEIVGVKRDPWYFRKSIGTGIRMITPMGVFRFEYGTKLDKKPLESPSRFDFNISGLF